MVVGLVGGGADAVYELQSDGELPVLKVAVRVSAVRRQPVSPASASSAADSFGWGSVMVPSWLRMAAMGYPLGATRPRGMAGQQLRVKLRTARG